MHIRSRVAFAFAAIAIAAVVSPVHAAVYNVTTTADSNDGACTAGLCSLRDAITAANANPGADQIILATGQTYTLSVSPGTTLVITDGLTISGNGSTINGGGLDRVFDIQGNFTVTFADLTITAGVANGFLSLGGGIRIQGATVFMSNVVVSGNSTALESGSRDDGGGIAVIGSYSAGTSTLAHLTLSNSSVSNNQASNGGGIVCVLCALTITNSTIDSNVASGSGGGIDMVGNASTLVMTGSDLTGNTAAQGGGLAIPFGSGSATLNYDRIANNAGGAILNQTATLNVNNDWWGCNYGPGTPGAGCSGAVNAIQGVATLSTYLVLKVSAAPPTLPLGATSTIAADLTMNSMNVSTAPNGTVPNGIAAAFNGTLGTFASPSTTTSNGRATDVYTATGPKGTATVAATIDGQTVTTLLNVGYPSFTDDPIVPGVTIVKAVHITELRTMINNVRQAHGLAAYSWTSAVAPGTVIGGQHILDLRTALAQVYTALAMTQPSYTDPTLPAGTVVVKAAHISEIRSALIAVE